MNKTTVGVVVAIVLVAAGAWFFYSKNGSSVMGPKSASMTMKELLASGVSQKCTFTEPQSQTAGTVYIANGKVRADFTSKTKNGDVAGHMISDGTTAHTWMDGQAQGMKASFSMAAATGSPSSQQGLNPDSKTDYSCSPWSADQAQFTLPSNVTFLDVQAIMQGNASSAAPSEAVRCSVCDKAPAAQRAACRSALQCK